MVTTSVTKKFESLGAKLGTGPLFPPPPPSSAVFHVATNPDPVLLESEVKRTSKYPVDDVYSLLELTEPEIRASRETELHDDEVH